MYCVGKSKKRKQTIAKVLESHLGADESDFIRITKCHLSRVNFLTDRASVTSNIVLVETAISHWGRRLLREAVSATPERWEHVLSEPGQCDVTLRVFTLDLLLTVLDFDVFLSRLVVLAAGEHSLTYNALEVNIFFNRLLLNLLYYLKMLHLIMYYGSQ